MTDKLSKLENVLRLKIILNLRKEKISKNFIKHMYFQS